MPRARLVLIVLVAASAAVGAAASGAGGATPAAPASRTVTLRNIAFSPAALTVRAGSTVTWRWKDQYSSHNIHAVGTRRFPGATERRTGTYTVRLTKKGTYRYTCTLHPGMDGKIVVS